MNQDYKLYKFDYIKENQAEIIKVASFCHQSLLSDGFGDTTWNYYLYNIFSVSSPSIHFWNIFKKLNDIIRENIKEDKVWMQSWLNYHDYDQVLDWHNHSAPYHGYVSIEPQDTTTEFGDWNIENEVGNIYFGRGNIRHRVVNKSKYSGKRITIGFDVMPESCYELNMPTKNYGSIPLL